MYRTVRGNLISVSYTHLCISSKLNTHNFSATDKFSQHLETNVSTLFRTPGKQVNFAHHRLNVVADGKGKPTVSLQKSYDLRDKALIIIAPVSYTHLDVYKRQEQRIETTGAQGSPRRVALIERESERERTQT